MPKATVKLNEYGKECGCNLQSCSYGCPKSKPIAELNLKLQKLTGLINEKNFENKITDAVKNVLKEAFLIATRTTPFIGFTGKICPAPCQSSCTNA